jgi:CubicO group peptidase (beta-lactamase class C family)
MSADLETTGPAAVESSPRDGLSRRRLVLGAAGVIGVPWLARSGLAAETASEERVLGPSSMDFRSVREEFARNFAERGEVGASLCVIVDGEVVVDLWGGTARVETDTPWSADTICHLWSGTKGATALCAHMLVSRGLLDLDAPVVEYWPEFGQRGKEAITVRMLLSHQAGVPALRERLPDGAFYDWDRMTDALAAEAPFWEPGTRCGYHALTFGFLVGELVRRISGRPLGTFFRDEVAKPLDIDFWLGLPAEEEARVAPLVDPDPPAPGEPLSIFLETAISDPTSIPALAFFNTGGYTNPGESDTRAAHAAVMGAVGGMSNARGLAHMYAALIGGRRGVELVDSDTLAGMGRVAAATSLDATGLIPTRWALGYVKSMDNRGQPPGRQDSVILGEAAFGHPGFGGCIGFVDPEARLAFGYTMNKMGQGTALNARGQALVDATYRSLGYVSNESGSWRMSRGRRTSATGPRRLKRSPG